MTSSLSGQAGWPDRIELDSGPVCGTEPDGEGVRAWLGIPFARPPVGPLRWRPPRPPLPWRQVRSCVRFGPACPQPPSPLAPVPGRQDEDCLYLNVWSAAPDPQARRPVMVWIHGGGNTVGSASQRFYNGSSFAANGVVLVTLQYRLGILGYLAHPGLCEESPQGLSGNYGLQDILAALDWVRRHISRFGGDPDNVTVFGESAGAVNCGVLMVCPAARGLFHKVILQSGIPVGVRRTLAAACRDGREILGRLGIETIEQARRCPADRLVAAVEAKIGILQKGYKYGPVIDGFHVPDAPLELMRRGAFDPVPLIVGTNADEATVFTAAFPIRHPAGYRLAARALFGKEADAFVRVFPPDYAATPKQSFDRAVTVMSFVAPARQWLRAAVARGDRVYQYHFVRTPACSGKAGLGAAHGMEIPYVFNRRSRITADPVDRRLAGAMQRYWIAFARSGRPAVPDLPHWPAYDAAGERYLRLGDTIESGQRLYHVECDFFDRWSVEPPR